MVTVITQHLLHLQRAMQMLSAQAREVCRDPASFDPRDIVRLGRQTQCGEFEVARAQFLLTLQRAANDEDTAPAAA